ncbi:MAG: alkaline phosphatase family protein, partial [Longimicrobiales bacterium]
AFCLPLLILLLLSGCGGGREPEPEPGATSFWPVPGPEASPRVLLIGIDGVRVDVLREVPTPNLDALAAAGFFSETAGNVRPTVSGPCWSSMLIGVGPEKHGVLNNDFSTNRYARYPDFLTRIEEVTPELRTFAAVDWLPLGTTEDGGPLITDAVDRKFVVDGYDLGWSEADSVSVMATVEELRTGDSDALFVYLGAPDEISHTIGGIGDEYRAAIATADRHVGRLTEALRARPAFEDEDWLILVSTDHGRTEEGGHGGDSPEETTVFFLASGPGVLQGPTTASPSIKDIPVTALAHLGIAIDPAWGLDGQVVGLRR